MTSYVIFGDARPLVILLSMYAMYYKRMSLNSQYIIVRILQLMSYQILNKPSPSLMLFSFYSSSPSANDAPDDNCLILSKNPSGVSI